MIKSSLIITQLLLMAMLSGCAGSYEKFEAQGCNPSELEDNFQAESFAHLSVKFLTAVRDSQPVGVYRDCLAQANVDSLNRDLSDVSHQKAFWINVYNAYIQVLLLENPDLYKDRDSWFGYNFFSSPQIPIAGRLMSFDDIEHGIMRRSTHKLTMGYVKSIGVPEVEKKLRWDKIDPRIHFALNCGAISCPYIAIYHPNRVEQQLRRTTEQYLQQTTEYNPENNTAHVTRLMSWFRGDFGGLDGAKAMLKEYGAIPPDTDPELEFNEYDWTLELGNYQDL